MPIFRKSIVEKHLQNLDENKVDWAFGKFRSFYGDPLRLRNIMQLKEENYQEGFLREIFVQVLGYTLNPDKEYDLTTEFKNLKDSKKADGAILKDGKAIGVIELKSTKTKDLESIKEQAFGYKINQPDCKYVITSNFQNIRLYIDNATEYEEFNLFDLSKEQFRVFYLLLNQESITNHLPEKLKQETQFHDKEITEKLYKDYKTFKDRIFDFLVSGNPQYDKITLFKKSQKLLDRFLFVFFAEDSGLIPPNAISKIIDQWKMFVENDENFSLYSRFQKFFQHLDKGHVYKQWGEIPAYNGGLFRHDEILDDPNLVLPDGLLQSHALSLSAYDFGSEVDVNILGHIFEHSLSEIEEMEKALLEESPSLQASKPVSKRKKDGIFYTPKYITKYIVENTVGTLCSEKKTGLGIDGLLIDEGFYLKNGKLNPKGKALFESLQAYKSWLLTLKILDPACGSGAFLNQTLDFLIAEHKAIDNLISELTGDRMRIFDTDKHILENNIYGVDINEESVEIAKLSLWLRTARRGRALSDLSGNIKCGNSLIDDPAVAGEKAFDWEKEFPPVFDPDAKGKAAPKAPESPAHYGAKTGGFDVVLGNPPYVDIKGLEKIMVKALFKKYETAENRINLYSIFIEKAYHLAKDNGFVSFITPNSILVNSSYTKIRTLLLNDMATIIKLPDNVFSDAKVETIVFAFRKNSPSPNAKVMVYDKGATLDMIDDRMMKTISKEAWEKSNEHIYNIFVGRDELQILQKIESQSIELKQIANFSLGITPYDKYRGHSEETIKNRRFHSPRQLNPDYKPLIAGENITRYHVSSEVKEYIHYGDWLGAMREAKFFTQPRLIVRQIVSGHPPRIYAGFTEEELYFSQIGFSILPNTKDVEVKFLACLLNSKLMTFYHKHKFLDQEKSLFQKILIANCKQFPIRIADAQQAFIEKADAMLALNKALQTEKRNFISSLQEDKGVENVTRALENFHELEYDALKKELLKQKVSISLGKENNEWREYFNATKNTVNKILARIGQTDSEIDRMVYELYELSPEEIETVENSTR